MQSMIAWGLVILAAALAACADPTSPIEQLVDDPAVAALARERVTDPVAFPDSVGIPPSIPPIFEEVPMELLGSP